MPAKGNVAQFVYAQFYTRYQGKAYGQLTDPANVDVSGGGVTSHAYLVRDPIRATIPQVTRAINEFVGGAGLLGQMMGGIESLGQIDVEFANFDGYLMQLANKSLIDTTTISGATIVAPNHSNPVLRNLGAIFTARFQSREAGSDGDFYYINFCIPNFEMEIDMATFTREAGRNVSPARGVIRPSFTDKFFNGVAFGANQNFHNNRTDYFYVIGEHPYALTTFIAGDTETEFTLGYLPVNAGVTSGNTVNWFTKNGTPTAPSSVDLEDGGVAISAATEEDLWHAFYQTDLEAIPA